LNPYAYAGNSPLMYVDPNGEWFFTAILSAFGPLGTLAGAALDGGMMSAAINVGAQLVMTGQVNWSSVGNSFASGALSAGLSFGVGEMGAALGMGKDLAFTTIAHGISGGIQSAAFGGDFWSGVAGGVAGNLGGSVMGNDLVGRLGVGALAGGAASWAAGGDFWQGAQAGAYNGAFNHFLHKGINSLVTRYGNFGGPGWTGGNEYPAKGPVDSMDETFAEHDSYYDKKREMYGDLVLLKALRTLDPNPEKWARPPSDIAFAVKYRSMAIDYFSTKVYGKTGGIW